MSDLIEPLRFLAAVTCLPLIFVYVRDDSITRLRERLHLIRTLVLGGILVFLQFP